MKPDTWMPLYVGDYLRDTMHLTTEEHGAYMLLLFHAWMNDGRLPAGAAKLATITHQPPDRWQKTWRTIRVFFCKNGSGLTQKRLLEELERAKNLQKITHKRAVLGAKTRWEKDRKVRGKNA